MTSNPDFDVTPLVDAYCLTNDARYEIITVKHTTRGALLKGVISNDLERSRVT